MPKVSVIMPSLNVEKYIKQCIESVINQTFSDIEIICVDAGSTDGTLEILKEYAEKDSRITIINSGKRSYGYQMNLGIAAAEGEYIGIVETDDFIENNMYEILYNNAVKYDVEFIKGNRYDFGKIGCYDRVKTMQVFYEEEYNDELLYFVEKKKIHELILKDYYVWNGIYKAEFVKTIRFNETPGAAYQDIGFLAQVFTKAEKAAYINIPFYHYRLDNSGSSCYNKNAFKYLAEEYEYVNTFIDYENTDAGNLLLKKLFGQVYRRIMIMAYSGDIWGNAEEYLNRISKVLKPLDIPENNYCAKEVHTFVNSPLELYYEYKKTIENNDKLVSEYLENISGENRIVIFGCGLYGEYAHLLTALKGFSVVACCDNSEKMWGKELNGVGIISPSEVIEKYPDALYVIANKNHRKEICKQLVDAGIAEKKITYYNIPLNDVYFLC